MSEEKTKKMGGGGGTKKNVFFNPHFGPKKKNLCIKETKNVAP